MVATPTPNVDVKASFVTQKHGGELPFGASFGFSNDVEVPLPYDSRTNDFTLGTEWTNAQEHAARRLQRVVVRQPGADADLGQPAPPRRRLGRAGPRPDDVVAVQLGADDQLRRLHEARAQDAGDRVLLLRRAEQRRAAAAVHDQLGAPADRAAAGQHRGLGEHRLDEPEPRVAPGRPTGASARGSASYDYNNETPATSIPQMVSYDSSISSTPTGGPDLFAHSRTTFDADATWTKLQPFALGFGYTHNGSGYDARIFESSGEDMFRLSADAVGASWMTFRASLRVRQPHRLGVRRDGAHRHRRTSGNAPVRSRRPDPQPRHRPVRHRSVGRLYLQRLDGHPQGRLQQQLLRPAGIDGRTFSLGTDYHLAERNPGAAAATTTSATRVLQRSHEGDSSAAQFTDPLRDWTSDATETVHYFSIYAAPPRIGGKTEVRFSYDFSHAEGSNVYTIPAGSPIPPPNQLPDVFNKLQQLHIDAVTGCQQSWGRRSPISTSR